MVVHSIDIISILSRVHSLFICIVFLYSINIYLFIIMEPSDPLHLNDTISKEKLHAFMISDYRNAIRMLNQASDHRVGR